MRQIDDVDVLKVMTSRFRMKPFSLCSGLARSRA